MIFKTWDLWGPSPWIYETKHLEIYDVQHLGIYVAQHVGIYETQDLGIYEAQHLGIYETQDLWGIWYRRFYDTVYSHAISTNLVAGTYSVTHVRNSEIKQLRPLDIWYVGV